jgi:four helix bundle protein
MIKQHHYKELNIWKEGMELVRNIYSYSSKLPDIERFGLISQLNRCVISLPANIAEGSGRTEVEFNRFLKISLSSSYELDTLLEISGMMYHSVPEELMLNLKSFQNKTKAFMKTLDIK